MVLHPRREAGTPGDQRLDLGKQRIASGIECRPIERRITIESVEAVARQHCAKECRHGYAPLGVEPQHVMGDEAVHFALRHAGGPLRKALALRPFLGLNGLSWDNMGVNGPAQVDWAKPLDFD